MEDLALLMALYIGTNDTVTFRRWAFTGAVNLTAFVCLRGQIIFGPKREEDGSWRKLHNDEIHNLYSSPNIVRVIKSRRMRWAGHVARMG
jgi:hypothetical protein